MGIDKFRSFHYHYILEGAEIVPVDPRTPEGVEKLHDYMLSDKRKLFRTEINGVLISTVFLTIDHGWFGDGPPVLFETMVFRGSTHEDYMERYCTYDQAHAGHILTCAMVGDYRLSRKLKKKLKKWVKAF